MIPFVNLTSQRDAYRRELEAAESRVLNSGNYVSGEEIRLLERNLSNFCENTEAICCASGTDALTIALMTLGIEDGDEVIVPDFTFIAPAECVKMLHGTPKFADINESTLQIDPKSVESLITDRTRGIIAVDLFGQCAPYRELQKLAKANGLWIIEDSAQAFGAGSIWIDASYSNAKGAVLRKACTFGDMAITSFYPSKPLGCYGDGGAIFTRDSSLAERARQIANHGSRSRYVHDIVGMNSRLDEIQAAVLNVKLRHFEDELAKRRENAAKYDAFFMNVEGIRPQRIAEGNTSTYAQYTLLVDNRPTFLKNLERADIPYCIHYPKPLHMQPCFAEEKSTEDLKITHTCRRSNAEKASEKAVSLPVCAFTNVDCIIEKLRSVL